MASLDQSLSDLATALNSLPTSLSNSLLQLPQLLSTLSQDVSNLTPSLSTIVNQKQIETILLDSETSITTLNQLLNQVPNNDIEASDHDTLIALIQIGTTKYDIMTMWSPDVWSIMVMFILALICKIMTLLFVNKKAIARVEFEMSNSMKTFQTKQDQELIKLKLMKPTKAMIGHGLNAIMSTLVLAFQIAAWRLFVLPQQPMRFNDVRYLCVAMKLLTIGYAVDITFGDVNGEIILHHLFTFGLLMAGQICVFETRSPKFFRLANWLILQATLEQPTYVAMMCYHASTRLKLQQHRSNLQKLLLKISYVNLVLTKWITFPQKIVPAVMSLYWLGRMWNDIDDVVEGRFWIGWCLTLVVVLLVLQVKFCDDIWPLTSYVEQKLLQLETGESLSGSDCKRTGPIMTLLSKAFSRNNHRRHHQSDENTSNTLSSRPLSTLTTGTETYKDTNSNRSTVKGSSFVSHYVLGKRQHARTKTTELPIAMMFVGHANTTVTRQSSTEDFDKIVEIQQPQQEDQQNMLRPVSVRTVSLPSYLYRSRSNESDQHSSHLKPESMVARSTRSSSLTNSCVSINDEIVTSSTSNAAATTSDTFQEEEAAEEAIVECDIASVASKVQGDKEDDTLTVKDEIAMHEPVDDVTTATESEQESIVSCDLESESTPTALEQDVDKD
ncbi:hypothetical protein OIO90_002895 [Microbotryomycetes sp. JL221]|nr:hypothetical protein OIO90_002895 [Microbotryomycetes sp. JL221]